MAGSLPNLRFAFADAHVRRESGGWARQVTERELPVATTLAGVNMRLEPGAVRELHWHKQAEWAYMLGGTARIHAVDADGHAFADDVGEGDLWYFPAGIPHVIQGLRVGCEFLLVFDDGGFSEDATFLISDWLAHTPPAVLAHDLDATVEDLAGLPEEELYIFPAAVPPPLEPGPRGAGTRFSHRLSEQEPARMPGGTVRIADATNFPVATTVAAGLVELEPGALRELHWHPNADEWQYHLEGDLRMTVFAAEGRARTVDLHDGDVAYVPHAMGHYLENVGETRARFLELFRAERFMEVSLRQWMALTPLPLLQAHLHLGEGALAGLSRAERPVVA